MPTHEPLGASARALGAGRTEVSLLSRGDRVRAVVARGPGEHAPLILIGAPDGRAHGVFASAALHAFASFATVAALDLPLCGSRRSDKLSDDAYREGAPLAARLRVELELQLGCDLARLLDWLLRGAVAESPAVAWLALGLAARLEPRPPDPRLRALLRAPKTGQPLAIASASTPGASGPTLADFEPSARNLELLGELVKRAL